MEKRRAHYDLTIVKAVVAKRGMDAFTRTAKENARLMGLDGQAVLEVVATLQHGMLYESTTAHANSQVWQDVYHAPCTNGSTAYIKVTLQAGATVIQFKEK